MNETEFLRGLEGEEQQGTDLVSGAEHLVRLKIQAGQQTESRYEDLDLEKKAFFGGGAERRFIKQHNAWAEETNRPENVELINKIMEEYARKTFLHADRKQPLSNLHEREWEAAYAHANAQPHFLDIHKRHFTAEKKASAKEKLRHLIKTNPVARNAAINGIAGGTIGAATGAVSSPGHRLEGAAVGGATGATLGAASGGLQGYLQQKLAMDWDKTMTTGLVASGALAGALGTYLGSRTKDSGKSSMEEELEAQVETNKNRPEDGFARKIHNRNTEHQLGYAKAFKEHPVKGTLFGAGMGASLGYGLSRLGGIVAKARGGK